MCYQLTIITHNPQHITHNSQLTMDDTKKTLLSIDIDTDALTKNVSSAKDAVKDLTDQLNALKTAGQANTPVFAQLSTQLKTTTTDYTNATKALKDYNNALADKTKAEQAGAKTPAAAPTTPLAAGAATTSTQTPSDNSKPKGAGTTQDKSTGSADTSSSDLQWTPPKMTDADIAALGKIMEPDSQKRLDGIKDYNTAVQKLNAGTAESQQSFLNQELKILDTRDKAYEDSANTVAGFFGKNTEASKAALIAKKAFGVAEIAMNTEQQISSIYLGTQYAVTQDLEVPIIGDILAAIDIAGGVVKVAAAIANGATQVSKLNSISVPSATTATTPGKARGGIFESDGLGAYLTGPGTGTSDSINARLSNGESVINARSTAMFAPILSAINQAGGGVAFHTLNGGSGYAAGGIFSGSNTLNDGSNDLASTRAINNMIKTMAANLPRQVLVVEDVQASLQNKVMLQNMSNF